MYKDAIDKLIDLEKVLVAVGGVERADYWPGYSGRSRETVVEHSYFLAVMSWQAADWLGLKLDHEKILKYALVHDLPEAYAGDLPLFSSASEHAQQERREFEAVARLEAEFPGRDLVDQLKAFYAGADEEARFVRAMDKLVPLFVHIVSEKTQFLDNHITPRDIEQVLPKWRQQTDMSDEMAAFTSELLEVWYRSVKLAAE